MNCTRSIIQLAVKSLVESIDAKVMQLIAGRVIEEYDIYDRTGFPRSIPIPNRDVAQRIVSDVNEEGLFLQFVSELINIHENGHMGRQYTIQYLRDLVKFVHESGYSFDRELNMFFENPKFQITRNWGALRESHEYTFALLRIDIVNNSRFVREYPKEQISAVYSDIRKIVQAAIETRNGRLWIWEGDGGLGSFYFSNKHRDAALSGMNILHDLYLYNRTENRLDKPISVRIAIHGGDLEYSDNNEIIKNQEEIKRVVKIEEELTPTDSVTISIVTRMMLDDYISRQFSLITDQGNYQYFNYAIRWAS